MHSKILCAYLKHFGTLYLKTIEVRTLVRKWTFHSTQWFAKRRRIGAVSSVDICTSLELLLCSLVSILHPQMKSWKWKCS
jgi:hypothetical protein